MGKAPFEAAELARALEQARPPPPPSLGLSLPSHPAASPFPPSLSLPPSPPSLGLASAPSLGSHPAVALPSLTLHPPPLLLSRPYRIPCSPHPPTRPTRPRSRAARRVGQCQRARRPCRHPCGGRRPPSRAQPASPRSIRAAGAISPVISADLPRSPSKHPSCRRDLHCGSHPDLTLISP